MIGLLMSVDRFKKLKGIDTTFDLATLVSPL